MVQIADLTVLGKSYFRIIWDQWRVSFLSSEIITFAVILILARSGRKKNVFSGEGYKMNFERVKEKKQIQF